jgi:tetratricopeptide (TPR) repeat protein
MTWQTTVDQLNPPERALLEELAWLAPEPIPVSLLDSVEAGDALNGLVSWSLAKWSADREAFSIHRLVQEIARQRLCTEEQQSALERALELVDGKLPSALWDQQGWQLWENIAPHCRALLARVRDHTLEPKATRMMNQLALWLHNRAEYGEAETLYRRALAIDGKSLGPFHPDIATRLNNLASLLQDTDRLAEAEPFYRRALAIDEKALGPTHPGVATDLNNLALLGS